MRRHLRVAQTPARAATHRGVPRPSDGRTRLPGHSPRPATPSLRHGLPYGWWKNIDVWAGAICLIILIAMLAGILVAWFLDLKPNW